MKRKNEKVTVAIPVYNGEDFIGETLKSIIAQTRKVDHVLICDNQSTDNTLQIVNKIKNEHPDIEFQIHKNEENLGHRKNFNKCMELCNSDYLLILSCDDILRPHTIEKEIKCFKENPKVALVAGKYDMIDENGTFIGNNRKVDNPEDTVVFKKGEILEFIKKTASWVPQSMVLMKMKYIRQIGMFDDRYLGFDELYWPKVLQRFSFVILGEVMLDIRLHQKQDGSLAYISKYEEEMKYLEARKALAYLESSKSRIKKIKKYLRRQVSNSSFMMGEIVWKRYKKYLTALRYWLYGIRQAPVYVLKRFVVKRFHLKKIVQKLKY